MRISLTPGGMERLEARFHGHGFSPHRHDTYALGLTLHGVQTFRYRGSSRFSQPGNILVLHPDEVHDGAAGTEVGLIYRMVYLSPHVIGSASHHRNSLPFVSDPIVKDKQLLQALADLLGDLEQQPTDLLMDDATMRIVSRLEAHAQHPSRPLRASAQKAVQLARDFLDSHADRLVRSTDLEAATGLDRYELARQFRRLTGTSPHRYVIMRRLERAKSLIIDGLSLADIAFSVGFADQAHFTRHFRRAFGMTPGRWSTLIRQAGRI
ncbi:AraC family transcriptional regulator [Allorhizobium sp. BGMRC 0089]|uniref:helix-turn-helix transcriptional regulator n=1 Tax=Allorhizobium sonneratiae TaxID=2934936 RepID=UPI0020332066|nr:AraC family transcriptional regulator [Allorhizobium sonneratiae]MCM2290951.1 AraC family transcriptional regulator [Allorhizobium sonneratiae]